ncbi:unnamed protein product, partial [Didymodactylos carnosus]
SSILSKYVSKAKIQFGIKRSLSLDVKNRWNSSFYMMETFLMMKNVIIALHNDKNGLQIKPEQRTRLGNLDMTTDEWALLETIQNVLKLFDGATKIVSGREYATIGTAYYTINVIKECLTDHHTDEHQLNALKNVTKTIG